jgi:hypothetical protein
MAAAAVSVLFNFILPHRGSPTTMPNILPFSVTPEPLIDLFPAAPSAEWRRELHACRTFYDAAALAYRIIREVERADVSAKRDQHEIHQLAFPWAARAD